MCVGLEMKCSCGVQTASLHNESVLPYDIILSISCPECSREVKFDKETMVGDNGWIIEYDMEIARHFKAELGLKEDLTPDIIFDKNLSGWTSFTPTDVEDKLQESQAIIKLAKTDPKLYFSEIKRWNRERVERLKNAGWRKLNSAVIQA